MYIFKYINPNTIFLIKCLIYMITNTLTSIMCDYKYPSFLKKTITVNSSYNVT